MLSTHSRLLEENMPKQKLTSIFPIVCYNTSNRKFFDVSFLITLVWIEGIFIQAQYGSQQLAIQD